MRIENKVQMACLRVAPVALTMIVIGLIIARMVPPMLPSASAGSVHEFYRQNSVAIRLGIALSMFGATLMATFVAVLAVQMKRIKRASPALAYIQLLAGLINWMLAILPFIMFEIAAFRTERSAELVQLLNDAAWLCMLAVWFPGFVEILAVGYCAFCDRHAVVFPRWYAWFSVWLPFLFVPDTLVLYIKDGPFSWSGVYCFWTALTLLLVWTLTTIVVMRSAIQRAAAPVPVATPGSEISARAVPTSSRVDDSRHTHDRS